MREPVAGAFPWPGLVWLAATRPAFLTVTLLGCLLGLVSAWHDGHAIDMPLASVAVIFALCAHAAANVINDYGDARNGGDALNHERLFPFTGGSRFIQNGVLSATHMLQFAVLLTLAVVLAGLWLAWHVDAGLIWLGMAGLGVAWAYSLPPLQLMCRGLGELAIVAGWLIVVAGADFVMRGAFAAAPWLIGLSYALLVMNILFINEFPDRIADATVGKRTLVVRLGVDAAKWGYLLVVLLAHGGLLVLIERGVLPRQAGLALLTLIPAFRAARELLAHAATPAQLAPAIRLTIATANAHGLLLITGLWWAGQEGVR